MSRIKAARDYMKNKDDCKVKPPCYAFAIPDVKIFRQTMIPVYLETQDPDFYLTGRNAITAKMANTFDRAFYAMFREERKKARAAFYFFKTRPDLPEIERQKLQDRSRELFVLMQNLNEEVNIADEEEKAVLMIERQKLNDEFHKLVERNKAITIENPWMRSLLQYNDYNQFSPITHQMVLELCNCIYVKAEIIDSKWLANPIYADEPGFKTPKMEIKEIICEPTNKVYRDVLPDMFRSKYTMQNYPGRGNKLYREWAGGNK